MSVVLFEHVYCLCQWKGLVWWLTLVFSQVLFLYWLFLNDSNNFHIAVDAFKQF